MNKIVNKFLLAGDKFIPDILAELQILLTEMSWINLVFNMIWLMVNQEI